jgi:hypothetical protein
MTAAVKIFELPCDISLVYTLKLETVTNDLCNDARAVTIQLLKFLLKYTKVDAITSSTLKLEFLLHLRQPFFSLLEVVTAIVMQRTKGHHNLVITVYQP